MAISNKIFQELYQKLNEEQKLAVDTIEGPVMVVAGPGTGKTQILTLRIANILLRSDTNPSNILALTFTDSGAIAMRKRLVEIIGSPAYYVHISTFHGFCNEIIRTNPEDFPHLVNSRHMSEIEHIELLKRIIEEQRLTLLKPYGDPLFYLKPIISAISHLKREGVSPEQFREIITKRGEEFKGRHDLYYERGPYQGKMRGIYHDQERQIKKNRELVELYVAYQNELKTQHLYDYNDMILEVIHSLEKNEDLLLRLQEQYQYILVDEHQDTNRSQNHLLELLCSFHENPNLFVVGDEKQAIFRFQGASLANFLYFKDRYPHAKLIVLTRNYRSLKPILDCAASVMRHRTASIPPFLQEAENLLCSQRSIASGELSTVSEDHIKVIECSEPDIEYFFLAKDVDRRIRESQIPPEEIAVLYRDNNDAFPVGEALEKQGIPFIIESDENVLHDIDIRKLVTLLRAIEHFGKDEYLIRALHIDFFGLPSFDVYTLITYAERVSLSLTKVLSRPRHLYRADIEAPEKFQSFYRNLSNWRTRAENESLVEFFGRIIRESGFLTFLLSLSEGAQKIDKVRSLFDELKRFCAYNRSYTLKDFLEYLDLLEKEDIAVHCENVFKRGKAVHLMTAHKAKGLEFDYVYIINAHDTHWSNRKRVEHLKLPKEVFGAHQDQPDFFEEQVDDERRLFYVALTRARKGVTITFAQQNKDGREQLPCQFIEEIDAQFRSSSKIHDVEGEFVSRRELLFTQKQRREPFVKDKEFFLKLFQERGLSVTALNNYLSCPWKYFYVSLLRIPKTPSRHQMYGIVVHEALRIFFELWKRRQDQPKDFFLSSFEIVLKKQPLHHHDFNELLEKGRGVLSGYYDTYEGQWPRSIVNEFKIRASFDPSVDLVGKLDRIDRISRSKEVIVTDYKTGRPKTRGYIEGKTKDSDGSYLRQLVFYKLLIDLYSQKGMTMERGVIDFVEPDEKGKWHKEEFFLRSAQVQELSEMIKRVSQEIMSLSFWDSRCQAKSRSVLGSATGNKQCEYCGLREMML